MDINPSPNDPNSSTPTAASSEVVQQATPRWHYLALAGILLLAIFLHFYRLEQEGFANLYYAAAVNSMLTSWHNFFFVSFDPGGFVSVDKPPLGLWVQVASAFIFGFQGWSLLLPQALAGVLSVALLYYLVRRVFGSSAGLIAALVLAVTPISIAANRNNTMDSLLVLTSLLAAWAASLAAERGRLRWLLVCAALVGLGFNIKMLQAFMILPAVFLIYLTAPLRWWKRLLHLVLATVFLAVVSLSWVVVVDQTPPDQRPYVGSSHNNTVMELIVGHNGMARLGILAQWLGLRNTPDRPQPGGQPAPGAQPPMPGGQQPPANQPLPGAPPAGQPVLPNQPTPGLRDETGSPSPLRLFNRQLAGQASWLLPLALLCILPIAWQRRMSRTAHPQHQALLLWAIWLVPQIVFFSYAGLFHRYYLEMLAPGIAALVGAGLVAMRHDYDRHNLRGWLLPLALLGSAVITAVIIEPFLEWSRWLIPLAGGLALAAVSGLVILRLAEIFSRQKNLRTLRTTFSGWFVTLGLLALLISPLAWATTPVLNGGDTGLPFAGPDLPQRRSGSAQVNRQEPLTSFLLAEHQGEKYFLAVINARTASPFMLTTGEAVMALGGFSGSDPILTVEQLAGRVAAGEVRFFLIPPPARRQQNQGNLLRWVWQTCRPAPAQAWETPRRPNAPQGEELVLFDCRP